MLVLEKLSENLNLLMKKSGITTNVLARLTNIPASTIKKLRNSSNTNPTLATLIPIADYFSITIEKLIYDDLSCDAVANTMQLKAYQLPIIGWEESLGWSGKNLGASYTEILSEFNFSQLAFALKVMHIDLIKFPMNSLLLIEPSIKPTNNDLVLTYKKGQPIPTVKQFICEDESAWLQSIMIKENIIPFSQEHHLVGVIIESRHRLKTEIHTL